MDCGHILLICDRPRRQRSPQEGDDTRECQEQRGNCTVRRHSSFPVKGGDHSAGAPDRHRHKGDRLVRGGIAELVMVTGGRGSSVVSIRGDLDLKTIASLSDSMGIEELEGLDQVEKK